MFNINEVNAFAGLHEYWIVSQGEDFEWYYEKGVDTLDQAHDYCAAWPRCNFRILHHTLTEVE